MRAWLGRSDPPFLPSRQRHPAEICLASLPPEQSGRFPSFAQILFPGKSGPFLAVAEQSSRLPAALVLPGPPSIHLPSRALEHPLGPAAATRAAPTGRTPSVGKGGQCQGHAALVAFEGTGLPWAAAGGQRCHCGVTSGAAGGARWPFCRLPSLLRARPREGAEGWQPPGALPGRAGPLDGFCSESPRPAPRPARAVGSGCGASRGGREG